jgi:hypothetical protein
VHANLAAHLRLSGATLAAPRHARNARTKTATATRAAWRVTKRKNLARILLTTRNRAGKLLVQELTTYVLLDRVTHDRQA